MRLHAIELWVAITLVSVEGDIAAAPLELPTAKSRLRPPLSAGNATVFQPEKTSRKAESPAAISEERGIEGVSAAASLIRQVTELEGTARTTRAADKLQLEDNFSAAVPKLGSPTPLDEVLRIANERKPSEPLNEGSRRPYSLQNAVDNLVHARQSTSEAETKFADIWWGQLVKLFVEYDEPIAKFDELLKVSDYKGLTIKLEKLKQYIGISKSSGPDTFLETMKANLGGEEQLVSFIGRAMLNDEAEGVAKELEGMQIAKWQANNKDPVELLKSMQMDESMDALISPALSTVMKYIHEHNVKHPDEKFSVLTPIRAFRGDIAVKKALTAAKNQPHSRVTTEIAVKLLSEMSELRKGEAKSQSEITAASGLLIFKRLYKWAATKLNRIWEYQKRP